MAEEWICAPSCPIRLLDEQGKAAGVHAARNKTKTVNHRQGNKVYAGGWAPQNNNPDYYGSDGDSNCSRFFKTFPPVEQEDNLIEPVGQAESFASACIIQGDCVEAMRAMPENSVDSVVTDPPYGLEFMGKEWDRLGGVGKTSHQGPTERDGATVFGRQRVAYNGSSNVRCYNCNKWKWGHKDGDSGGGGKGCQCDNPSFPNPKAHQARIMQEWHEAWAREALRVLKPGGYLLAFGGTRTVHRLACAIEDAGFEIRDRYLNIGGDAAESMPGEIAWVYGSG